MVSTFLHVYRVVVRVILYYLVAVVVVIGERDLENERVEGVLVPFLYVASCSVLSIGFKAL